MKEPKVTLELRFDAPATPARVAAAAQFMTRVVAAADPSLEDGGVTLVVSNLKTVAGLRPWTTAGNEAVRHIEHYAKDPAREVERRPEARRIAAAVAEAGPHIAPFAPRFVRPRAKKAIARVDSDFVLVAQRLATPPAGTTAVPRQPIAGSTVLYTPVYRAGRLDDGKEIQARIRIDDTPREVGVTQDAAEAVFDAAKSGNIVPVHVACWWVHDDRDDLVIDHRRVTITGIDTWWRPISGAEFLDKVHGMMPDAFADLDHVLLGE